MPNQKKPKPRKADVFAQKPDSVAQKLKKSRKQKQGRLSQIGTIMNW